MTKKSSFLTGQFLDDFLAGQKNEKRRHAHHRSMSYPGPGVHWGTIGGQQRQPINSLSNTPLGQRPGELIKKTET